MQKSILIGLGFDCTDGDKRITLGENYRIYGGSKQTHRLMLEQCIKFNEHLKKRNKTIQEISAEEFYDIAEKQGFDCKRKRF